MTDAPFWPPSWTETFLGAIDAGLTFDDACKVANEKIFKVMPTDGQGLMSATGAPQPDRLVEKGKTVIDAMARAPRPDGEPA